MLIDMKELCEVQKEKGGLSLMKTVGSLFSGIGGLEYGLEQTGNFKTIWNCEIEAYPSAVLRKHWYARHVEGKRRID